MTSLSSNDSSETEENDFEVYHKNDCEMYVFAKEKGIVLKQADVADLDKIAPLMYKLEIPVDIHVPQTIPMVHRRPFIQKVIGMVNKEFDRSVWKAHKDAREDNADFFCSLVDIFGTLPVQLSPSAKVTWRLFGFNVHIKELNYICGIDNLVYGNVSKKLDTLQKNGDVVEPQSVLQS